MPLHIQPLNEIFTPYRIPSDGWGEGDLLKIYMHELFASNGKDHSYSKAATSFC